jgi:hypothetical protein
MQTYEFITKRLDTHLIKTSKDLCNVICNVADPAMAQEYTNRILLLQ